MQWTAVYHKGNKRDDIARLTKPLPEVHFIPTATLAELKSALSTSPILIMNGSEFTPEISEIIRNAPALKWIQFTSSGLDIVLKNGGVPASLITTNVAGLRAGNLSEHAFGMLLFLTRQMRAVETARQSQRWIKQDIFPALSSLQGQTMLIIGMGAIGQAMAIKAKAFGMHVLAISRGYSSDENVTRVYPRTDLLDAIPLADVIMMSVPSDASTRHLLSHAAFAVMKPTAIVLNVARGAPHIGGAGSDQLGQLLDKVAQNVRRFISDQPLANVVRLDSQS
ncbi:MAG: hypothetical protein EBY21_04170 [Alphaproteobacteria bacterium]|nr:hypothetical protein [Alphaproteobacteria bacterium]